MRLLAALFSPLKRLIQAIVRGALRLAGVRVAAHPGADWTEEELRGAIHLHAGSAEEEREAGAMLRSILDLDDVAVEDIMVHRRNVVTIDVAQPAAQIVDEVLASPYTRLPLWRDEPDNIVGVLHAKALLRAVQASQGKVDELDIVALATPAWFIPESTSLLAQLRAFRARREHFALVVDEYGVLMGIVTLEDILEEIVGDIADEHDIQVAGVEPQPDGCYILAGVVTLRDLNREFGWHLPDDQASTIAGLVLHEARRIPDRGQVFVFHGFRFEILERQRNQIVRLRLTPLAPDASGSPEPGIAEPVRRQA